MKVLSSEKKNEWMEMGIKNEDNDKEEKKSKKPTLSI